MVSMPISLWSSASCLTAKVMYLEMYGKQLERDCAVQSATEALFWISCCLRLSSNPN